MKCIYFNGKDSTITISHNEKYNIFPLVISCWMKSTQIESKHCSLINKYKNGSSNGWSLNVYDGKISFWIYNDNLCGCDFKGNTKVCDGKWHNIKVTVDSKNVNIYVDGIKDTSTTCGINSPNTCTTDIVIGKYQGYNSYYDGYIAEFSLSDKMSSDNDIKKYKISQRSNINNIVSLWSVQKDNVYEAVSSTIVEGKNIKIEDDKTCPLQLYKYLIKSEDKYYSPLKEFIQDRSYKNLDVSSLVDAFKQYGFYNLDLLLKPIHVDTIEIVPLNEFKDPKIIIYNEEL